MYSIADYAAMIADAPRMQAYRRALERLVKPGAIVADIGSGTGIFALLACRLGARRVFAIEPADAIEVARRLAAANGVADRVVCMQAESTAVTLPERADVIVSDIRGILPLHGRHIPVIADARARLLAPGGTLVPGQDRLFAALVESPALHRDHLAPWGDAVTDLNLEAMETLLRNTWSKAQIEPSQMVSEAVCVATLDYTSVDQPDLSVRRPFTTTRGGTAHALAVWFETDLHAGIGFSNAPGQPKSIYGQAWFPLDATNLAAGESLDVRLDARLVGNDYVWRWGAGTAPDRSSLHGIPLSRATLHKSADRYVPRLTPEGMMVLEALDAMRAGRAVGEIAQMLVAAHPGHFGDWKAALTFVGALSQRYSE